MSDNGSSSMMVAIVAILVIVALGFIALQMFPRESTGNGGQINVELPSTDNGTGNQ